jgi:hypothetical protein
MYYFGSSAPNEQDRGMKTILALSKNVLKRSLLQRLVDKCNVLHAI